MSDRPMTRTLLMGENEPAELRASSRLFHFELRTIECREPMHGYDSGPEWKQRRIVSGHALFSDWRGITVLRQDGSQGTSFRSYRVHINPEVPKRELLNSPPPVPPLGLPPATVHSYITHVSEVDDPEGEYNAEFLQGDLEAPVDVFNSVWDELKFGQGNIMLRFTAALDVYKPAWPDDYFIAADSQVGAQLQQISLARKRVAVD